MILRKSIPKDIGNYQIILRRSVPVLLALPRLSNLDVAARKQFMWKPSLVLLLYRCGSDAKPPQTATQIRWHGEVCPRLLLTSNAARRRLEQSSWTDEQLRHGSIFIMPFDNERSIDLKAL